MLEFAVENIKNSANLKKSLQAVNGISMVEILRNEVVLLETVLSHMEAMDIIEKYSGSRAVLQGFGVNESAVAMIDGNGHSGVIRLSNVTNDESLFDGTIDGLTPGKYFLNIHVSGDLSQGCDSIGPIFEPAGKLGSIDANSLGRANFKFSVPGLQVNNILGRSIAVSTTDDGKRIACGIIARSAGLFQNDKKICACDGVTLWNERNVPVAGQGRRNKENKEAKL